MTSIVVDGIEGKRRPIPDLDSLVVHDPITTTHDGHVRLEFVIRTLEAEVITFPSLPLRLTYKVVSTTEVENADGARTRTRGAYDSSTSAEIGFPLTMADLIQSFSAFLNGYPLSQVSARGSSALASINEHLDNAQIHQRRSSLRTPARPFRYMCFMN